MSYLTDYRRQSVVYSRISRSHVVFGHSGWTLFVSGQRPYVNLPDLPCSRAASRRAAFAFYSVGARLNGLFQVLRPVSLCAVATRLGFSALVCGMPRRMPIPQSSTGTSAGFSNDSQWYCALLGYERPCPVGRSQPQLDPRSMMCRSNRCRKTR